MLYQNRQVVLSQLSPFPGQYLVKLNRSVVRPENFAAVAPAASYNAQKSDEKAASSFQVSLDGGIPLSKLSSDPISGLNYVNGFSGQL
jgi:hypothetical protein